MPIHKSAHQCRIRRTGRPLTDPRSTDPKNDSEGDDGRGVESSPSDSDALARAHVDELNAQGRAARRIDNDLLLEAAERAFELACRPDSTGRRYEYGMASALSLLAHHNCVIGEWPVTLSQCSHALSLLAAYPPDYLLGDIYDSIGWAHYYMGDYVEAVNYLMKSLEIGERIGDRSMEAHALDRLANVHASSGHPAEALEWHERALSMHRDLGDEMGEAIVLNNIAYTLMDLGDLEYALRCATDCLEYCERSERPYLHVGVLDTLADIHLAMGDLDLAEEYATRALAMALEERFEPDETNALMTLGEIAARRHDHTVAIAFITRALEEAQRRSQRVEEFECHRLLSDVFERQGDTESALRHFKEYHRLKEDRVNAATQGRLANLRVEHQVESARKDAEILRLRSLALEREVERQKIAQAELEAQASLDSLTGLFNRRHLPVIADQLHTALESGVPVSLMLFDIDRFKEINDNCGHGSGDRVLVAVAHELSRNARHTDMPCRYGGDEFLVLLIDMDVSEAGETAERLRRAVAASPVECEAALIDVTISAGVASAVAGANTTLDQLIERADKALYAAKQAGRNNIMVYGRDL